MVKIKDPRATILKYTRVLNGLGKGKVSTFAY